MCVGLGSPLAGFGPPSSRGGSCWLVVPPLLAALGAVLLASLCLRCLEFAVSFASLSSLPDALVDLRREVLALELEARDLRCWGRPALAIAVAIAVEREMRIAQERFDKAALAYKKLGLV